MSRYLVDQIEAKSNVRVWSGCEVRALEGDEELEAVVIRVRGPIAASRPRRCSR